MWKKYIKIVKTMSSEELKIAILREVELMLEYPQSERALAFWLVLAARRRHKLEKK